MSFRENTKKLIIVLIFLLPLFTFLAAQNKEVLLKQWEQARLRKDYKNSPQNVYLLNKISEAFRYTYPDSSLWYAKTALTLARQQRMIPGELAALNSISKAYYVKGAYDLSLETSSRVLLLAGKHKDNQAIAEAVNNRGLIYLAQDKYATAIPEFRAAALINETAKSYNSLAANYVNLGICFDETAVYDSALFYLRKVIRMTGNDADSNMFLMAVNRMGETYFHMGRYTEAIGYYRQVLKTSHNNWELCFANTGLAQTYYQLKQYREAVDFARKGYDLAKKMNVKWDISHSARVLAEAYAEVGDYKNAYIFQKIHKQYNDSLFTESKEKEINYLHLQQKLTENRRLEKENKLKQQEITFNRLVILLTGLATLLVVAFALLIYRNNRRQKWLNIKLGKKNIDIALQKDKIEQQNKELSRLNYTKDQLFSIISHDLRGPMSSIQQAAELMCGGNFSAEEQRFMLEDFYREITLVNNMVNNMLHWASSQQRGIRPNITTTDISAVTREILEVYSILAKNKGINIIKDPCEPVWIDADPDQMKVIIQNLLGNAIKFTPMGGTVHIFFGREKQYRTMHIRDTGIGITEEKMNRLFKAIGKSISTYGTNSESGTGLGLTLVKEFTEANGGTLQVKSKYGEGSEFIISFKESKK